MMTDLTETKKLLLEEVKRFGEEITNLDDHQDDLDEIVQIHNDKIEEILTQLEMEKDKEFQAALKYYEERDNFYSMGHL
jgi:hypothetical protein